MCGYKNKEWLENAYKTKSINEIAAECGVASSTIRKYMKRFGIKSLSVSESMLKKYQDEEYLEKKKQQWQSTEYRQKHKEIAVENSELKADISRKLWEDERYRNLVVNNAADAVRSPEVREKLSAAAKKKWGDAGYREKQLQHTEESSRRFSEIMKSKWRDSDYRKLMSEQSRSLWDDADYRASQRKWVDTHSQYLSLLSKKLWEDYGWRTKTIQSLKDSMTDEKRNILSQISKKLWENEEYRQACVEAIRRVCGTQEHRQKLSTFMKLLWAKDEYRENQVKQIRKNSTTPEYRRSITMALIQLWKDEQYRIKVVDGLNKIWDDQDKRDKQSETAKLKWEDDGYRIRMAQIRAQQSGKTSAIQEKLYQLLDTTEVNYHREGPETRIGYYVFDCLIPQSELYPKNLLIECQGDYWHSLPRAIGRDKAKFTYINRYFPNHEIMYVWEHEFYTKDRVLDRLLLKLGIRVETIDFNFKDIAVSQSNNATTKEFLANYHYLGAGRGGQHFIAIHDNKVIGVIVYSSLLRDNIAQQFDTKDVVEISRLCIHPSYHKKNFASWFISRTLKYFKNNLVIAYADTTVGHKGTVYKACNFYKHHEIKPDYWYADADGYVMHKMTLYKRAVKFKITESEFAERFGYHKVFGGPKICYCKVIRS